MKLVALDRTYWPRGGFGHWCPGCKSGHEIDTEQPNGSGAKWSFDGNMESPTFAPSINCRWGRFADPNWKPASDDGKDHSGICHYFIQNGNIVFCGDCTHALVGQTVPLPEIPPGVYMSSVRAASKP